MSPVSSRRSLLASAVLVGLLPAARHSPPTSPKTINIDWATYNPVSMVLKEKGLLEKEFAKDGIGIRWVQTLGSNKALEFLNAGSIDFGSTAGSAALVAKINGNPIKSIYVYSRPEWTALVTRKDTAINKIEDLKGKRVAVTRGTDPHIFLVRALQSVGLTEKDIVPVLLQHPDGKTALIRGDVDAWAGLDPMMAQAEVEDGARLFYRNKDANTWGILNVREEFLKDHPDLVKRVLAVYEEARKYSLANYDEEKQAFHGRHQAVRRGRRQAAQGAHRDHLQQGRAGAARIDSAAGIALQQSGVIQAGRRREKGGRRPDRRSLCDGEQVKTSRGGSPSSSCREGWRFHVGPVRFDGDVAIVGVAMSLVQMTITAEPPGRPVAARIDAGALGAPGARPAAAARGSRCCGKLWCAQASRRGPAGAAALSDLRYVPSSLRAPANCSATCWVTRDASPRASASAWSPER